MIRSAIAARRRTDYMPVKSAFATASFVTPMEAAGYLAICPIR